MLAAIVGFVVAFVVILGRRSCSPAPRSPTSTAAWSRTRSGSATSSIAQFPFPAGAALDWAIAAVAAGRDRLRRAPLPHRRRARDLDRPGPRPGRRRDPLLGRPHRPARPQPAGGQSAGAADAAGLGGGDPAPDRHRAAVQALPAGAAADVAIAETLQVYPVAGSQVGIASASFVVVGALCLADGLTDLRAWSDGPRGRRRAQSRHLDRGAGDRPARALRPQRDRPARREQPAHLPQPAGVGPAGSPAHAPRPAAARRVRRPGRPPARKRLLDLRRLAEPSTASTSGPNWKCRGRPSPTAGSTR